MRLFTLAFVLLLFAASVKAGPDFVKDNIDQLTKVLTEASSHKLVETDALEELLAKLPEVKATEEKETDPDDEQQDVVVFPDPKTIDCDKLPEVADKSNFQDKESDEFAALLAEIEKFCTNEDMQKYLDCTTESLKELQGALKDKAITRDECKKMMQKQDGDSLLEMNTMGKSLRVRRASATVGVKGFWGVLFNGVAVVAGGVVGGVVGGIPGAIAGAYAVGVVYNVVVNKISPEADMHVSPGQAVVEEAVGHPKFVPVEYAPVLATTCQWLSACIDFNIRHLMAATPTHAEENSYTVVLWPEYGVVSGVYMDPVLAVRNSINLLVTRWGGGSYPFGGGNFDRLVNGGTCDHDLNPVNNVKLTLSHVGCVALAKKVYLVANLLMKPKHWNPLTWIGAHIASKMFNTNVVFKPDGKLLHIYQKMRPVPAEAGFVTMATNNPDYQLVSIKGKLHGLMVCYDILFPESGYRRSTADLYIWLFTTKWTSARDLISILVQQAFSRATQTIVAGANVNVPYAAGLHGAAQVYTNLVGTGSGVYVAGEAKGFKFQLTATATGGDAFSDFGAVVDTSARPAKYFTDDNVDVTQARADVKFSAATNYKGRKQVFLCIGGGCHTPGVACEGAIPNPITEVHNNKIYCPGTNAVSVKFNLDTRQPNAGRGDPLCEFDIKAKTAPADENKEFFIVQVDHGVSADSYFFERAIKGTLAANRHVKTCLFQSIISQTDYTRNWNVYNTGHNFVTKFEEVKIKARNFHGTTAVLPIAGFRSNDAPSVVPFAVTANDKSSWKNCVDNTHDTCTILTVTQTADSPKPLLVASLYAVYNYAAA